MADNVNISSVNGDRAEMWATQKTLEDLVKLAKDQLKLTKEQLKEIADAAANADENSEVNDDVADHLRNLSRNSDREARRNAAANRNRSGGSGGGGSSPRGRTSFTQSVLTHYTDMVAKDLGFFGKMLKDSVKHGEKFSSAIQVATVAVAKGVTKAGIDIVTIFNDAYKSGAVFTEAGGDASKSMFEFTNAALAANVSLTEFGELSSKYAVTLKNVGIKEFGNAAKEFKIAGREFGLTAKESAEYLAEHLEQQRKTHGFNVVLDAQAKKKAVESLKMTAHYSQALGMSVKALQEKIGQEKEATTMLAATSGMNVDTADVFRASVAALPDHMQGVMKDIARFPRHLMQGIPAMHEFMKKNNVEAGRIMMDYAQAIKSGEINKGNAVEKEVEYLQALAKAQQKRANLNEKVNTVQAQEQIGQLEATKRRIEELKKQKAASNATTAKMSAAFNEVGTMWNDMWKRVTSGVFSTADQDGFIKSAETVAKGLITIVELLGTLFKWGGKLIGPAVKSGIEFFTKIFEAFNLLADFDDAGNLVSLNFGAFLEKMGDALWGTWLLWVAGIKLGIPLFMFLLKGAFKLLVKGIASLGKGLLKLVWKAFTGLFGGMTKLPVIGWLMTLGWGLIKGIMKAFDGQASTFGEAFGMIFGTIATTVFDLFAGIGSFILGILDSVFGTNLKETFDGITAHISGFIEFLFEKLGKWISNLNPLSWFGGDDDDAPKSRSGKNQNGTRPRNPAQHTAEARTSVKPPTQSESPAEASQAATKEMDRTINSTKEQNIAAIQETEHRKIKAQEEANALSKAQLALLRKIANQTKGDLT